MSKGFDISFEGLGMDPDDVQDLLKKYKVEILEDETEVVA